MGDSVPQYASREKIHIYGIKSEQIKDVLRIQTNYSSTHLNIKFNSFESSRSVIRKES